MAVPQPTRTVLEETVDLVGVNHWERAIETHAANHPWARHFHDDIQNVNPREVFDERNPTVTILSGGIECTHWSAARGGKPVDEQQRMPAWDFLTWVQKLRPEHVLVENVPEFRSWGPVDEDDQPTRNGETFDQWINSFHSLGYSLNWTVLNAADYGDPTSRERLFIMATREGRPTFPDPTHTEDGHGDTEKWRPAAEIIDWSDPGGSIWTRDLHDARKRPLKNSTVQRIAEGLRRHCDDRLAPFANVLEHIGRDDVKQLRQQVVPAVYSQVAAQALDQPFLVACPSRSTVAGDEQSDQYLLRQQTGGTQPAADAELLPTISAAGSIAVVESEGLVMPRNTGEYPVSPSIQPFIDDYEGPAASLADPLGTVTSRDRFALCVPELYPWGLDVRYRMLQPRELKQAQGFPQDYEIRGNKTETTEQIGNAVPVTLAQRLVESLLSGSEPALTDYVDSEPATVMAGDD
ncbi:hypothetical protein GCM10009006_36780 [Haloarcula argentinensis]|uniref:DNA (cytosine-5-)-methyltransferase n=2 Tax=Haloarcula argentinensis TaxID=43776 RepID=A0A830FWJ9_HALAR|nr:hypothetical protein GCM10009006_36780 [Haloarcula argentinensis]